MTSPASPSTPAPVRRPLMPLDEARATLLSHALPDAAAESIPTFEADGRVLAENLVSALQVPPQDNSSMDGYAVRVADVKEARVVLPVSQRIAAGHAAGPLRPGTCARIFTGATMPEGADAVVMQEDTRDVGGDMHAVHVDAVPVLGQWVRRSGEDVTRGATVLARGQRLSPAGLGLAASLGLAKLSVFARPKVALFSTGDELVMPGDVAPADMKPGAIYNSNRFFLRAMLQRLGCEVSDLGIVPDSREKTLAALKSAADHHDLILTSGGVSVGEEDHVKPAVQQLGSLDLWQIAMKPGKPFAYGTVRRDAGAGDAASSACHFIGLPGNPVSSFVTFVLLVRPFLLKLQGAEAAMPQPVMLPAHFVVPRADKRREFLRVRRNANGGLDLFPNQSSGVLTSAVWGDGLVDNPAGRTIAHGDLLPFISFSELLA
ncbi:molybdopterin molybdenumtransferase MoeA [Hydrogenophaga crassostreae]|uniref:Molybdopterin molybdenumtransferase n=1 Tax=Hydrogenophaga crassostreae TaxID=1763535 RepID=A0A163C9I1_9BURK|nr:gephyrin-like molybdotransferase Glp [Hydrogenophaga crassostreae]AOW15522.1 molybdopterin molybdenumtransferase MoeA [Hydrogenophaga crassostreae]OAD40311.1 molybdopterin molybdenumtransferase MoeA [Hydrogenophaga crassostreae]